MLLAYAGAWLFFEQPILPAACADPLHWVRAHGRLSRRHAKYRLVYRAQRDEWPLLLGTEISLVALWPMHGGGVSANRLALSVSGFPDCGLPGDILYRRRSRDLHLALPPLALGFEAVCRGDWLLLHQESNVVIANLQSHREDARGIILKRSRAGDQPSRQPAGVVLKCGIANLGANRFRQESVVREEQIDRGRSSAGRASRSQCEGRGFESLRLHFLSAGLCGALVGRTLRQSRHMRRMLIGGFLLRLRNPLAQ